MRINWRNKNNKERKLNKPIFIFCYHKSGTVLFNKILNNISVMYNLNYIQIYGYTDIIPAEADIVLFSHSIVSKRIFKNSFIGVHIVRDPRELIISGYLYHKRTKEEWCTTIHNKINLNFPYIPTFLEQSSEVEKINYINSLKGTSYQAMLKNLSQEQGIIFEINNYSGWTIDCIDKWDYKNDKIMEVKFENIMKNFNEEFSDIVKWLGFKDDEIANIISSIQEYDISNFSKEDLKKNNHISNEGFSKWEKYFSKTHKRIFKQRYPQLLQKLSYTKNDNW